MEIAQVCIASWGNNAVLVVLMLVQHSIDIGTVSGNTICSFVHLLSKCLLIFKYFLGIGDAIGIKVLGLMEVIVEKMNI